MFIQHWKWSAELSAVMTEYGTYPSGRANIKAPSVPPVLSDPDSESSQEVVESPEEENGSVDGPLGRRVLPDNSEVCVHSDGRDEQARRQVSSRHEPPLNPASRCLNLDSVACDPNQVEQEGS